MPSRHEQIIPMITPKFRVITDEETDSLEKSSYNPPVFTADFTKKDFEDEWTKFRDDLKRRLELFGDEWTLDHQDGHFMLGERGVDRWIYITFTSTRLWSKDFVFGVVDLLSKSSQDYAVGCLTELNNDEIFENPLVYLVITRTQILGNGREVHSREDKTYFTTDASDVLLRFGFPDASLKHATSK